jgi:hypothetical protein
VPRFAFSWLQRSTDGAWTVADLGMLVAVLGMFESETSLFANSSFERDGDELVLTVRGGLSDLRFAAGKNGSSVDSSGSGLIREREALRTLVRNGWFEASDSGALLKIKLGERAKKVREGKEAVEAVA